jgi:tetratricopeptide (TPR) repeat protein
MVQLFTAFYDKMPLLKKPIGSIITSLILCLIAYTLSITSENIIIKITYFLVAAFISISLVAQAVKANTIPKAHKGNLGILLIIKAENAKHFAELDHKFTDLCKKTANSLQCNNVEIISINKNQAEKYKYTTKDEISTLLMKTNCMFKVDVDYYTDDCDNENNYEINIGIGVLHPKYHKDNQNKEIVENLNLLSMPIRRQKFSKNEKIDTLRTTATYLGYVCEFLTALVLMLSGNYDSSHMVFNKMYDKLNSEDATNKTIKVFLVILPPYLYRCRMMIYYKLSIEYDKELDNKLLVKMKEILDSANNIIPDTYEYYIEAAFISIMRDYDANTALQYINKARKIRPDDVYWRYSDAFLSAYMQEQPFTIYRKYKKVFKMKQMTNLLSMIFHSEKSLEDKPSLFHIHFALGLMYEEINDYINAVKNYKRFREKILQTANNEEFIKFLDTKIKHLEINMLSATIPTDMKVH